MKTLRDIIGGCSIFITVTGRLERFFDFIKGIEVDPLVLSLTGILTFFWIGMKMYHQYLETLKLKKEMKNGTTSKKG